MIDHVRPAQLSAWFATAPEGSQPLVLGTTANTWPVTIAGKISCNQVTVGCDYFCFLSGIDWMPSPYGRGEDDPTQPAPERSTEISAGWEPCRMR